jgi:HK97 family phage prohead protease
MRADRIECKEAPGAERAAFLLRDLKFASAEGDRTFSGYGAVFGNVDSYGDVIQKGAFKKTLQEHKDAGTMPAMLSQHGGWLSAGDMMPIGVWTSMSEDDTGLLVEGKLSDTPRGQEAYTLLKDKALTGMSIGYVAREFSYGSKPDDPRRVLKDVDLMEVSLVTFPANPLARVDGVKAAHWVKTIRDFEGFLRDVGGFSHAAAKAIAAGGFKANPDPRDEDGGETALAEMIARAGRVFKPS